jgi:hypothetical protein
MPGKKFDTILRGMRAPIRFENESKKENTFQSKKQTGCYENAHTECDIAINMGNTESQM